MTCEVKFQFRKIEKELGVTFANSLKFLANSANPISNSVMFHLGETIDITNYKNVILFCSYTTFCKNNPEASHIIRANNPRLQFIEFLNNFVDSDWSPYSKSGNSESLFYVHPTAYIHETVQLGPGSYVGPNCTLEEGVVLLPGAKLIENVVLAKQVVIGPGSVIGGWGFSIERQNEHSRSTIPKAGVAKKFPHFGGVKIGANSNIGSLNTICSGTLEPTLLYERVMTDDHVHIAHNCKIYNDVAIAMHAALSGGVVICDNCWIGPSVSILQKVNIGKESIVGMAANVLHDVEPFSTVVGNPARQLNH